MTNTTTQATETTTKSRYLLQVSCAKMPTSVKHPYVHVAVIEVFGDHSTPMIRDTKHQRVVRVWRNCCVGKTERAADKVAKRAARDLIASLEQGRA